MNILLITIALLVGLVVITKFNHIRTHLFYKAIGVVIVFVLASISYVWLRSGINLLTYEGVIGLSKTYFSWLFSLFENARVVTGYAVQQDWGLNSTIAP